MKDKQAAFRPNSTITDNTYILRNVIERATNEQKILYLLYNTSI